MSGHADDHDVSCSRFSDSGTDGDGVTDARDIQFHRNRAWGERGEG